MREEVKDALPLLVLGILLVVAVAVAAVWLLVLTPSDSSNTDATLSEPAIDRAAYCAGYADGLSIGYQFTVQYRPTRSEYEDVVATCVADTALYPVVAEDAYRPDEPVSGGPPPQGG